MNLTTGSIIVGGRVFVPDPVTDWTILMPFIGPIDPNAKPRKGYRPRRRDAAPFPYRYDKAGNGGLPGEGIISAWTVISDRLDACFTVVITIDGKCHLNWRPQHWQTFPDLDDVAAEIGHLERSGFPHTWTIGSDPKER